MLSFLSAVYAFACAHGPATVAFLIVAIPSLITGLSRYPQASGFVAVLQTLLNLLSVLSHHDSPGTFKLPLTFSKPPDAEGLVVPMQRGCVRLGVLIAIAAISLLALPAAAQTPTVPVTAPPAPTRTFGGCNKLGTFCAQPSGLITLTGYNITTKEVMATFQPGFGYGFTVHPEDWYAFGLDGFISLQPKTDAGPQRVSFSLVGKFANYLRVGIGRERIGDKASWVVPIGFGIDVSL